MAQVFHGSQLQHLSDDELIEVVPVDAVEEIKAWGDDHPRISVYSVGHEGVTTPSKVTPSGKVCVTLHYLKKAVRMIGEKLGIGTKVFNGHGETNAHSGRQQIGKVIGKVVKEVEGKLHALAAVYVFPQYRDRHLDVASFESECDFQENSNGELMMSSLENISGLSLSSSKDTKPAFPGATLRAVFQHTAENSAPFEGEEREDPMADQTLNLSAVKKFIIDNGIPPSKVFPLGDLMGDVTVVSEISERNKKRDVGYKEQTAHAIKERTDPLQETIASLRKDLLVTETGSMLEQVTVSRKLTKRQVAFMKNMLPDFSSEATSEDAMKVDFAKFIDTGLEDFEKSARLFGADPNSDEAENDDSNDEISESNNESTRSRTPSSDGKTKRKTGDTFLDNNPIPDDKNLAKGLD